MTNKVDVWMPLYIKDYLANTSRLTTEQHGAYLLLIMDYWLNGPLPDDDSVLCRIAGLSLEQWSKHRPSIARLFSVGNGSWDHSRIDRELKAARDRRKQAKERGKLGAQARWGKGENGASNGQGNRASIDQASGKQWSKDGSSPAPASTPSQSNAKEQEASASSTDADETAPEAKYTIPLTGGRSHPVTQADIDRYRELFPSIDVEQSIRAMLAWLDSNKQKRSGSARGAKTRMTSWLTRDQDKASRQHSSKSKPPIADNYGSKTYEGTPDDELPASLR